MNFKGEMKPSQEDVTHLKAHACRLGDEWEADLLANKDFAMVSIKYQSAITASCHSLLYERMYSDSAIDKAWLNKILAHQGTLFNHTCDGIHDEQTDVALKTFDGLPVKAIKMTTPDEFTALMVLAYSYTMSRKEVELQQLKEHDNNGNDQ